MVDSWLARTLKDPSYFDYSVKYLPGDKNCSCEPENGNFTFNPKYLPKG